MVVQYDGYGWLGCTMAVDAEAGSVTVKFLPPHLPSSSFLNPLKLTVQTLPPGKSRGRTYT